jgi:hypothetical protein
MAAALLAAMLATLALSSGCAPEPPARVLVGPHSLDVVAVADTHAERSQGLQGRTPLGSDEAMLFVWADQGPRTFAIKSVDYDLDVIFISSDWRVTEVLPLSPEGPTRARGSIPAQRALEVRSGWAARHDVEAGTSVEPISP